MTDIVILGGARTAIGAFGGALANTPPIELATIASKAALERSNVDHEQIQNVVFGHVINTEPRDMYLSRVAAMEAGVPDAVRNSTHKALLSAFAQSSSSNGAPSMRRQKISGRPSTSLGRACKNRFWPKIGWARRKAINRRQNARKSVSAASQFIQLISSSCA